MPLDSLLTLPPSTNSLKKTHTGLQRDSQCRLCRLCDGAEFICLLGDGPVTCKAMMIGEAPGEREDDEGAPFVGRSGHLLDRLMESVGLDRDDIYITNAVHCRPPDNRNPTKREIKNCKPWLDYEISKVKPKVVMLLGAVALESVLGLKGIKKLRGQPIVKDGITYLPALHPSYILRNEKTEHLLRSDLAKFKAMIEGGGMPRVRGLNYRIIRTRLDIEDMVDDLKRCGRHVYDCETTGLNARDGKVVSVGFGTDKAQWIVLVNHPKESLPHRMVMEIFDRVDELGQPQCNQNIKFDALWMKIHYGLEWRGQFDPMLAHHLLNENAPHSLDAIASEKYGTVDWDVPLTLKQGLTGTVEQHCRYLAEDLLHTYSLWDDLEEELAEQPTLHKLFHRLVMPASRMFVDIEFNGVFINQERFEDAEDQLREEMHQVELKLEALVPGVNWRSPQQVAKVLFGELGLTPLDKTKKGAPSTSESVLKRLAGKHEVPNLLMKRRAAQQNLSFFIDGWKPWLKNWYLHPSFKLHGTVTGRPSCVDPNLQQVPRESLIRALVDAPPGWVLIDADLSQIELRIAAELANDPEMMRCFQTGIDIHWRTLMRELFKSGAFQKEIIQTTEKVLGRRVSYAECHDILLKAGPDTAIDVGPKKADSWPGWKEMRKRAKAINFGYLYGMWWKNFIIYARDKFDVVVSDSEARDSRVSFFETYRKLIDWHQRQRSFARKNGYVRSLIGRKRRLPAAMRNDDSFECDEAGRQAINSPVQGFASDWNLATLLELYELHPRSYFRPVGTVHDSILALCRVDKVHKVVHDYLRIVKRPKLIEEFEVNMRVPIEGDVKLGPWSLGVSLEEWVANQSKQPRKAAPAYSA